MVNDNSHFPQRTFDRPKPPVITPKPKPEKKKPAKWVASYDPATYNVHVADTDPNVGKRNKQSDETNIDEQPESNDRSFFHPETGEIDNINDPTAIEVTPKREKDTTKASGQTAGASATQKEKTQQEYEDEQKAEQEAIEQDYGRKMTDPTQAALIQQAQANLAEQRRKERDEDYGRKLTDPTQADLIQRAEAKLAEKRFYEQNSPLDLQEESEAAARSTADFKTWKDAIEKLEPYKVEGIKGYDEMTHEDYDETTYDIARFLRINPGNEKTLEQAGFPDDAIEKAVGYNDSPKDYGQYTAEYFNDRGLEYTLPGINDPNRDAKQREFEKNYEVATDSYLKKYNLTKMDLAKNFGITVAENAVPGVDVWRNWETMSAGGKALWIAVDVVSIIPFVRAAGTGARGVSTAGRGARLMGGVKNVGLEALADVRAPVDLILHPVAGVKGTVKDVREIAENVLHPHKIPEAVITTSNGTVRLKVSEATTPERAKAIRDQLMELAAKGEKPIVEIDNVRYELSTSPLMKELKGGLAHATPMGEAFEKGITVERMPGTNELGQGLFVSHEPLPRFATSTSRGVAGEKNVIIITSKETAEKAISSEKLYRRTAEMERKFPVGVTLPQPKQKLFTRVGTENTRVELWLEKPLSKLQIAKLKSMGLIEDLKAPFKPAITIKGKGLTKTQVRKLAKELELAGNEDVARTLRQNESRISRLGRTSALSRARVAANARRTATDERSRRGEPSRTRTADVRARRSERLVRQEAVRADDTRVTGRTPASRTPETRLPDTRLPDERLPDGRTPDRRTPDIRTPEGRESIRIPDRKPFTPETSKRGKLLAGQLTETEKRKIIREAKGAIAWRQGRVGGRDLWNVIVNPYSSQENYFMVSGRTPSGATVVRGPKSAYKTAVKLYGARLNRPLNVDMGIMDMRITPSNGNKINISYKPDPLEETIGDINISKRGAFPLNKG